MNKAGDVGISDEELFEKALLIKYFKDIRTVNEEEFFDNDVPALELTRQQAEAISSSKGMRVFTIEQLKSYKKRLQENYLDKLVAFSQSIGAYNAIEEDSLFADSAIDDE